LLLNPDGLYAQLHRMQFAENRPAAV